MELEGTVSVKLTLEERQEPLELNGCFIRNDERFKELVNNYTYLEKHKTTKFFIYFCCTYRDLENHLLATEIKHGQKTFTILNDIPDNAFFLHKGCHVFLPVPQELLRRGSFTESVYLYEHSKRISFRAHDIDTDVLYKGLTSQRDGSLKFIDFILESPYKQLVMKSTSFNHLKRGLLLNVNNEVVGYYYKDSDNSRISIYMLQAQGLFFVYCEDYSEHYSESDDVYNMKSNPRGLMVIINIQNFVIDPTLQDREELVKELTERKGSERDVDVLTELFHGKLNFKVCTLIDKPRRELLRELRTIVENPANKDCDCLAVYIMSHGKDDVFYAYDGNKIKVSAVYNMFCNSNCEVFRYKPKLFFIQASVCQITFAECKDLDMADMLIAYSSFGMSYRYELEGSVFIKILVSVFEEYADKEEVIQMMRRVTNKVHEATKELHGALHGYQIQIPAVVPTLRKKLYLLPRMGVEECPPNRFSATAAPEMHGSYTGEASTIYPSEKSSSHEKRPVHSEESLPPFEEKQLAVAFLTSIACLNFVQFCIYFLFHILCQRQLGVLCVPNCKAKLSQKLDERVLLVDEQSESFDVSSHGIFLHVPQDTFKEKMNLTVNHLSEDAISSPAKDMEAVVSFMLALGPTDAILQKPVTITIMHSGPVGMPEYENIVMAFDEKTLKWEELQEVENKLALPDPVEDVSTNRIQVELTKLTAVTVVSRLIADSFQVPVTGCHVRSSVCHDVTLEFPEGAVNKIMNGSLKVLPTAHAMPKDMANVHLSPMVIVDGFKGVTLSKAAILTLPHPCPSKRPASEIHVMCFKENQWSDITESVKYSEIGESRIEIRIDHFCRWQMLIAPLMIPLSRLNDFYKWLTAPPQSVLFVVYKLKNLGYCTDNFKLSLLCLPCYMRESLQRCIITDEYDRLAFATSTMKFNEEASITVGGDFISLDANKVILKLEENICEKELNLQKKVDDTGETCKTLRIQFRSQNDDRQLAELTVYETQLGNLSRQVNPERQRRERVVDEEQCSSGQTDGPGSRDKYRMKSNPRGLMVIINIKKFNVEPSKRVSLSERKASEQDVDQLIDLFGRYLNFKVCTIFDETKKEIFIRLDKISTSVEYKDYDCLVVCIMSHGKDDRFYAYDGAKIKVADVAEIFSDEACGLFTGKPKLFFIEACRGQRGKDKGLSDVDSVTSDDEGRPPENAHQLAVSLDPDFADMLYAYSCFENYVSYRHPDGGSVFIQCLVAVFKDYADKEHVLDMLTRVKNEVRYFIGLKSGRTQMPVVKDTFCKDLYFCPQISSNKKP